MACEGNQESFRRGGVIMSINGNAPLAGKGELENTRKYYTRLDNFLILLVIWKFLPLSLVDCFINRGGKHHDD